MSDGLGEGDGGGKGLHAGETAWQRPGGESKQPAFTDVNPDTSALSADAQSCQDHGSANCQEGMRRGEGGSVSPG